MATRTKDRRSDSLPLRLDGRGLVLDTSGFQRTPIAAQRQLVDDGEEPGDRTINGQGSWKRTAWSGDHGMGQSWWDEDQDADRRQFRTSIGIDCWDRRELKLLHSTSQVSSESITKIVAAGTGIRVLYADGALETEATPTSAWSKGTPTATGVDDVVYDGRYTYWCTGTTVVSDYGSFTTKTGTGAGALKLFVVNGQLLGFDNTTIWRYPLAGTDGVVVDTASAGHRWGGMVDMGGETYSWTIPYNGSADDPNGRSRLNRHVVNETTTTLDPADPVLELPPGETITAAIGFANVIVLGTTKGIRIVTRTSGNDMSHSGLIAIDPAASMTHQVREFCADGQYVWFTWTELDGGKSGLGRLDLDEFIEFGVPAYATDLYASVAYVAGTTQVRSCASVDGRRFFAGNFGAYAETDNYVASGTYYSGWINFGSPERKALLSLELRGTVASDEEVVGYVRADQGTVDDQGVASLEGANQYVARGATGANETAISGEELEVKLLLVRGATTTSTPTVRRWTLRALPLPFRAEEIVLPVHVTERVQEGGVTFDQDPEELLDWLRQLYRDRTLVRLDLGSESMMVYVDGLGVERDSSVTKVRGWTRRRRALAGVWGVTVITTDVPVGATDRPVG